MTPSHALYVPSLEWAALTRWRGLWILYGLVLALEWKLGGAGAVGKTVGMCLSGAAVGYVLGRWGPPPPWAKR